jgi:hypothetical protein
MKTIAIKVLIVDRFHAPKEWRLEIPAMSPTEAANFVFELSNAPPELLSETKREILAKFPRTKLRSVSVGDVLIIHDEHRPDFRHICTVASCGFKFH